MLKNQMNYWDHLLELRKRIIYILLFFVVAAVLCYFIFNFFINIIIKVLGEELYASHITEGFSTRLMISIWLGVFFAFPFTVFQVTIFIFPALKFKEKLFYLIGLISSLILFITGVFFAFKHVLPISVSFLKSSAFFPENIKRIINYNGFIMFFFQFLIAFGICFQFPVIFIMLMKFGVLKLNFVIKNFKYFIVIIFVISAVLTPPDVISQILMAVPLVFLYLLTIVIAVIFRLGK